MVEVIHGKAINMDAKREIEAIALENLKRQRDEIDRQMKEIEENRDALVEKESVVGVFDGAHMRGEDGRDYPVPGNYASKSGLVEGDKLRLYLGTMVYKQIEPVERKPIFAMYIGDSLVQDATNMIYKVLLSSVSFFHIQEGDEVLCDIPAVGGTHAAIKGVTKRV